MVGVGLQLGESGGEELLGVEVLGWGWQFGQLGLCELEVVQSSEMHGKATRVLRNIAIRIPIEIEHRRITHHCLEILLGGTCGLRLKDPHPKPTPHQLAHRLLQGPLNKRHNKIRAIKHLLTLKGIFDIGLELEALPAGRVITGEGYLFEVDAVRGEFEAALDVVGDLFEAGCEDLGF